MSHEALSEPSFYILLSLGEPLHGYGIIKYAEELSSGRVKLGAGTLYGALDKMMKRKWISQPRQEGDSGRRKVYKMTDLGRDVLENEVARLRQLVKHGRQALAAIEEIGNDRA
jgi:DNA-binding PadR family transcriptional regulator